MVGRGGVSSSISQPDAWCPSPLGYSHAAHFSRVRSESTPDSRLGEERPTAWGEVDLWTLSYSYRPSQGGQSLISGTRLNINQVAALKERDRKPTFLGVSPFKEIPLIQRRATWLTCKPLKRVEHHIMIWTLRWWSKAYHAAAITMMIFRLIEGKMVHVHVTNHKLSSRLPEKTYLPLIINPLTTINKDTVIDRSTSNVQQECLICWVHIFSMT